jgi:hypothetical protein
MYSGEYDACDVTLSVHPHRLPGVDVLRVTSQASFSTELMLAGAADLLVTFT